jgi:hypothetical protein
VFEGFDPDKLIGEVSRDMNDDVDYDADVADEGSDIGSIEGSMSEDLSAVFDKMPVGDDISFTGDFDEEMRREFEAEVPG